MKSSNKKGFKFKLPNKSKLAIVTGLPYLRLVYYGLMINVLVIASVILLKPKLPPKVPLFYGLPEGVNQIGTADELIIPSMVSLLVILTNISISSIVKNEFLKKSLVVVSLTITMLSVITTLKIMLLIGSF